MQNINYYNQDILKQLFLNIIIIMIKKIQHIIIMELKYIFQTKKIKNFKDINNILI